MYLKDNDGWEACIDELFKRVSPHKRSTVLGKALTLVVCTPESPEGCVQFELPEGAVVTFHPVRSSVYGSRGIPSNRNHYLVEWDGQSLAVRLVSGRLTVHYAAAANANVSLRARTAVVATI